MGFLDHIKNNKVTLLDGAMGTELKKKNVMGDPQNNLDKKEIIKSIHRSYINAGSKAIITNTFSMNRLYLKNKDKNYDLKSINQEGVSIAREAAQGDVFVLGDISSTGKLLKPYGEYEEDEFIDVFKEKASYLKDAGVDAFIIETMVDLREAICALKACKEVSKLPVVVSISFDTLKKGGRTVMGNSVKECVQKLEKNNADIIGTNCGSLSPIQIAEVVKMMRTYTDLPILVQPNAGQPKLKDDKTIYDMSPEEFTKGILACIDQGASIVGGCCGTTPKHIEHLNKILLKKYKEEG